MENWWARALNHWPEVLVAASYVIAAWVLARVARQVVRATLGRIAGRSKTTLDDQIVAGISRHLGMIIVPLGLRLGLEYLAGAFPPLQEQVLFGWGFKVAATLVVLGWALLANALITALLDWYLHEVAHRNGAAWDEQILPVARRSASILVYFIAGTIVLSSVFGTDITGLVTTAGVASVAIALASQETLSNMISGFTVMVDRPFRIGDVIELSDGKVGEVIDIGLRSTKIRQFDGNALIIPNRDIAAQKIVNFAYPDPRRAIRETIGVSYETDVDHAKGVILDVLRADADIMQDPAPAVHLSGFGDSALNLFVVAWVADYRIWFRTKERIQVEILRRFRAEGIQIPFPQRDVHLYYRNAPPEK